MRIAIPNKGRLADRALELFELAGLRAEFRAERALVAQLGSHFQAILVRAQDIPEFVADGAAEFAVADETPVRITATAAEAAGELAAGVSVVAFVQREADGSLSAASVNVGGAPGGGQGLLGGRQRGNAEAPGG